jgi:flagellar motor switch protein FliM
VNSKLELIRLFGLSLGDVINLNRLAMQAADMSIQANAQVKIGASVMTVNGNMY